MKKAISALTGATLSAALGLASSAAFAAPANVEWPSYNGSPHGDRFSQLTDINTKNAADVRKVCEITIGDEGTFQPGPVVIGDTIFITSIHTVVAANATDCTVKWRWAHEPEGVANMTMPAVRGVAYMDGKLFRGVGDGFLFALDAATGKEVWRSKITDPELGEGLAAAPAAWNGLVFIGPAGSELGIRGRIMAFDAATGKEVWRFNTIPMKGEPGFETWHIPESAEHGGGGSWTSYTIDPETGELFIPVTNPAPDYLPDARPGDNLYTNAMVVLDARTGKLKWYYQVTPHDDLDYDLAAAPMLFTDKAGHKRVALGSKDGYLYIIDRTTHKLVTKTPITTIKRPPTKPTPAGVVACPGSAGGVLWNGPAYSPLTDAVYVGAVDWCNTVYSGPQKYVPNMVYTGTGSVFAATSERSGWYYGVSAATGKPIWKYHTPNGAIAGATPTAGGIVMGGDADGNFMIFDQKTGKVLKKENLGGPMGGGIITYTVAGKQYVATTTGNFSRAAFSSGKDPGDLTPKAIIMTTGVDASRQVVKVTAVPPGENGRRFVGNQGRPLFNSFCAPCHGAGGTGGENGPPLLKEAERMDLPALTAWIKDPAPPMPKPKFLTDSEIEAIAKYVHGLK